MATPHEKAKEKFDKRMERFRIVQQALRTVGQTIFVLESDELVFNLFRTLMQTRGYDLQLINAAGNKRQVMVVKDAG